MDKKYKNNYDNPYRKLACNIATEHSVAEVKRMLTERDYIRQIIQAEVRDNIDIPGPFSDCVVTELISNSQKVLYRDALNEIGQFFYEQLDVPRLRDEIKKFYQEFGMEF